MANEDPAFGGMGNADAISAAASAISGIRSDMAAIERHARGVAREMTKASQASVSTSGTGATESTTGVATPAYEGSALGKITQAVGGPVAALGFGVAGVGAAWAAAVGKDPFAGAIAAGGFNDLRVGIPRALNYERAQISYRLAGNQYGTFGTAIAQASNNFNVQNEQMFASQMGDLALFNGLTNPQIYGGLSGLTTMAGLPQEAAGQVYNSLYGNTPYYGLMAMNVQTRSVTGAMLSPEQVINQMYLSMGFGSMSREEATNQLNIGIEPGGMIWKALSDAGITDQATQRSIITGLRARIEAGAPLKENALGEQLTEAGVLGVDESRAYESQLAMENTKLEQTGLMYDAVTEGFAGAVDQITEAIDLLNTDFRDLARSAEEVLAYFDVFANEMPTATQGVTNAFGGLTSLLSTAGASWLGGALGARGVSGARGVAGLLGRGALSVGKLGLRALPGVGTVLAGGWGVNKIQERAGVGGKDFGVGDWFGTIAASAGIGAAAGTVVPGIGNIVGAIGGAIAGAIEAGIEESRDSAYETGGGKSKGDWFVEKDQITKIHYGEMVIPNRIANAVREELDMGRVSPSTGTRSRGNVNVNINVAIQRGTDHEAMIFAAKVKRIIETDAELLSAGSGRF